MLTVDRVRPGERERVFRILDSQLPSAEIRARVFGAHGRALNHVGADLQQLPGGFLIPVSSSDTEGRIKTRLLPPGRYRLRVAHPNHRYWESETLEIRAGQRKDLGNVMLKPK